MRGVAFSAALALGWFLERTLVRPAVDIAVPDSLAADVVDRELTTVDGGVLHWIERGSGRPVVLLHGITLDAGVWWRQWVISDRCRLMALDLRGHGASRPGTGGATIAANADDLAELLVTEDLHGAVLVGHSMGGMVVAHFLATAPADVVARVGGVVFVGSAVRAPVRPVRGQDRIDAALSHPRLRRILGRVPDSDAGRLAVAATFGSGPRLDDLRLVAASYDRLEPAVYWQAMPSILRHDVRARLAERDALGPIRVVIMVGTRDRLTPLRSARELAASFDGAELRVIEGAGHVLMLERPDEVNAVLVEMIGADEPLR